MPPRCETADEDVDEFLREVAAYLAAVALFREERCGPTWHPEDRTNRTRVRVRRKR